jgi:hypothetical protein
MLTLFGALRVKNDALTRNESLKTFFSARWALRQPFLALASHTKFTVNLPQIQSRRTLVLLSRGIRAQMTARIFICSLLDSDRNLTTSSPLIVQDGNDRKPTQKN